MFKSIFIFIKLLLLITIIRTEVKKTSDSIVWKEKKEVLYKTLCG